MEELDPSQAKPKAKEKEGIQVKDVTDDNEVGSQGEMEDEVLNFSNIKINEEINLPGFTLYYRNGEHPEPTGIINALHM